MFAIRRARCCGSSVGRRLAEREMAQTIVDDLRPVDYKATGTLQRNLPEVSALNRDDFDALLDAMIRVNR